MNKRRVIEDFDDDEDVDISSTLSSFAKAVYDVTKKIPVGKISTYKLVAEAVGKPGASRAVGVALSMNPYAPDVPCHRVISSTGSIGGYFGEKALASAKIQKKLNLLTEEGVEFDGYVLKRSLKYRKYVIYVPA